MATIGTRIFFPSPIVFVDADDGTLIHILPTGNPDNVCGNDTVIGFAQSVTPNDPCSDLEIGEPLTVNCGSFTITQSLTLRLETTEPLPPDFDFSGGSISRFPDRLSLFLEEFTPSRVPGLFPPLAPGSLFPSADELIRNFITRYDFVNVESLGLTDGTPSQTLGVSGDKILTPTKGTPVVTVGGSRWAKVDDLSTAGPDEEVFGYDPDTGTVTFGDGTHGKVPPAGQEVILKITIRNGGGKWEFAGIVEQPRSDSNIGILKGARDKLIYGQVKIAGADISQLTRSHP